MDLLAGEGLLLLLCVLLPICFSAFQLHRKRRQLPPGPTPWLFLENLLQKDVFPLLIIYEKAAALQMIMEDFHITCLLKILGSEAGALGMPRQAFDPRSNIFSAVSNVICSVVFGTRFDYQDLVFQEQLKIVVAFTYAFNSYLGTIYNTFPKIMDLLPGPHKKVQSGYRKLSAYFEERVEAHKRTLDPQNPRDYIDCFLINIKKEENSSEDTFSPEEIVPCVISLFNVGSVTTSHALLYSLYVMAKLPHIQAKVREEIDDVVGGSRAPGMEDRVRLPFINAVLHEILRYQKVSNENFPRETTCHTVFRGFTIPQDTTVVLLLASVHFDPLQWETPDEFNPGHFLDEKGKFRTRDALMPFSAGKRSCPGEALAWMELFLFFSTLLQNFTFQLVTDNTEMDLLSSYAAYRKKGAYPHLLAIKRSM